MRSMPCSFQLWTMILPTLGARQFETFHFLNGLNCRLQYISQVVRPVTPASSYFPEKGAACALTVKQWKLGGLADFGNLKAGYGWRSDSIDKYQEPPERTIHYGVEALKVFS